MSFRITLLLSGIFILLNFPLSSQVMTIAQARSIPVGSTVTVQGAVTNGKELGRIRFLQDSTAGIAAFPEQEGPVPAGFSAAKSGDSIEVSGVLKMYNGLLEISPITAYKLIASSKTPPVPVSIGIKDVGPAYEARLVHFDSLHFDNQDTVFVSGMSTVVDQQGNRSQIYLRANSPLIGIAIPQQPMELTAIVSRFNKGFQLLPLIEGGKTKKVVSKSSPSLASTTVTTTLVIKNCPSGKITLKNAAGYEVMFSLAHGSGTTQIEVEKLPIGAYVAEVKVNKQLISLPFQKI